MNCDTLKASKGQVFDTKLFFQFGELPFDRVALGVVCFPLGGTALDWHVTVKSASPRSFWFLSSKENSKRVAITTARQNETRILSVCPQLQIVTRVKSEPKGWRLVELEERMQ